MTVVNHAINQAQEPPMTNTHCSVCDVYFCGDIPAKQHYAGQKHAKKLKRFQITGAAASLAPAVIPPLPVKTQVGMNLEYCELCEMKLSPNPIEETFSICFVITPEARRKHKIETGKGNGTLFISWPFEIFED